MGNMGSTASSEVSCGFVKRRYVESVESCESGKNLDFALRVKSYLLESRKLFIFPL